MTNRKEILEFRHYDLQPDFPLVLLHGERWHISDQKSNRQHFHNCMEIGICHTDSGYLEFGGELVAFKAGDISIIPRYIPHTTFSSQGESSLWSYIFFDPDQLFHHMYQNHLANPERQRVSFSSMQYIYDANTYRHLYNLAHLTLKELTDKKPYYKESVEGLIKSLYLELLRIHEAEIEESGPVEAPMPMSISPALYSIYNHYNDALTIEGLAQECHLSPSHFRKIFQEIMGTSPLAFLNSTRIDEACKLLRSTELNVLEIAERVGYRSISSFNRQFRSLLGMTPTNWRKDHTALENGATSAIVSYKGWT